MTYVKVECPRKTSFRKSILAKFQKDSNTQIQIILVPKDIGKL